MWGLSWRVSAPLVKAQLECLSSSCKPQKYFQKEEKDERIVSYHIHLLSSLFHPSDCLCLLRRLQAHLPRNDLLALRQKPVTNKFEIRLHGSVLSWEWRWVDSFSSETNTWTRGLTMSRRPAGELWSRGGVIDLWLDTNITWLRGRTGSRSRWLHIAAQFQSS